MPDPVTTPEALTSVQRAFGKQALHYDEEDASNPILSAWRNLVYQHLDLFLKPDSRILELNAGTGIDAIRLVGAGHRVHATDISPGMIEKINEKISQFNLKSRLKASLCSYEALDTLKEKPFDYVFSNFGGLNCCEDLSRVTRYLPGLLNDKAYLTWVIMPPVCPWELSWILRGKKAAFRRLQQQGTMAHVEGEVFKTYYHSLSTIKEKLGSHFNLVKTEGLGALSPPPASLHFAMHYPNAFKMLIKLDHVARNFFPFNRCADHIIATFQYHA